MALPLQLLERGIQSASPVWTPESEPKNGTSDLPSVQKISITLWCTLGPHSCSSTVIFRNPLSPALSCTVYIPIPYSSRSECCNSIIGQGLRVFPEPITDYQWHFSLNLQKLSELYTNSLVHNSKSTKTAVSQVAAEEFTHTHAGFQALTQHHENWADNTITQQRKHIDKKTCTWTKDCANYRKFMLAWGIFHKSHPHFALKRSHKIFMQVLCNAYMH